MTERAEAAAERLARSRLDRHRFEGLPPSCRPQTEDDAYLVQELVHEKLSAAGRGEVVGHKIGCTTTVMQEYLRIPNPCAGGVFESTVRNGDGTFDQSDMLRVGVECELAALLGADLDMSGHEDDVEHVVPAIAAIAAAIEIVEDRYVDYSTLDTPTLIADDFFGAGCVLGEWVTDWSELDLATVESSMTINGVKIGNGVGADILGHPLRALAWLARARPLREGEFVLLGSLVQTQWIAAGDVVEIESPQLGSASARLV